MKLKLTTNVLEDGRLKVSKRRNKNWRPPRVEKDAEGKETIVSCPEEEYIYIPFTIGTVIEMSEDSAKKYIEKGYGVEVTE